MIRVLIQDEPVAVRRLEYAIPLPPLDNLPKLVFREPARDGSGLAALWEAGCVSATIL